MSGTLQQQQPGYYSTGTQRFWTRTKVGFASGLVGLALGLGLGTTTEATDPQPEASPGLTQNDVNAATERTAEDWGTRLKQQEEAAARAASSAAKRAKSTQQRAVKKAITRTRRSEASQAASTLKRAVAEARREATEEAQQAAAPSVQPFAAGGGTDPHFTYCYEALDAGYGYYVRGQDPEYEWYHDSDNDGVVCER